MVWILLLNCISSLHKMRNRQITAFYIWGSLGILTIFALQYYFSSNKTNRNLRFRTETEVFKDDYDDADRPIFTHFKEKFPVVAGSPVISTDDTLVLEIDERESVSGGNEALRTTKTKANVESDELDETTMKLNVKGEATHRWTHLLKKASTQSRSSHSHDQFASTPTTFSAPLQSMRKKRRSKDKRQHKSSTKVGLNATPILERQGTIPLTDNSNSVESEVRDQTTLNIMAVEGQMEMSTSSPIIPNKRMRSSMAKVKGARKNKTQNLLGNIDLNQVDIVTDDPQSNPRQFSYQRNRKIPIKEQDPSFNSLENHRKLSTEARPPNVVRVPKEIPSTTSRILENGKVTSLSAALALIPPTMSTPSEDGSSKFMPDTSSKSNLFQVSESQ